MKLLRIISVVGRAPSLPFSLGSGQDNRVGGFGEVTTGEKETELTSASNRKLRYS